MARGSLRSGLGLAPGRDEELPQGRGGFHAVWTGYEKETPHSPHVPFIRRGLGLPFSGPRLPPPGLMHAGGPKGDT